MVSPRTSVSRPQITTWNIGYRTWPRLAPRIFRPAFSSSRRCSRSSRSHRRAIWNNAPSGTPPTFLPKGGSMGEDGGHAVGFITRLPRRMCAMCVGNSFNPSKMWVASNRTLALNNTPGISRAHRELSQSDVRYPLLGRIKDHPGLARPDRW